jgi:diguanylate cyclase
MVARAGVRRFSGGIGVRATDNGLVNPGAASDSLRLPAAQPARSSGTAADDASGVDADRGELLEQPDSLAFEAFERSTRPLLELVRELTGLETSFISSIDWDAQLQTVVFSSNVGQLQIAEGSTLDWSDSMCRWAFLSGAEHSADVATAYPGSLGADVLGMQSFLAVPILDEGKTLGTLCGASQSSVAVGDDTIRHLRLIAESLAMQLVSHVNHNRDRLRADEAELLARTDSLTGLANHRAFTSRLEEELARSGRHDTPVSIVAMDIDSFKVINDTYGHESGNDVLVALADVLRKAARAEDTPARLGGDEFAVLLPETIEEGAHLTAARIADTFRAATAALGRPATLSIGVASTSSSSRRELMATADQALYAHKRRRRGQVDGN